MELRFKIEGTKIVFKAKYLGADGKQHLRFCSSDWPGTNDVSNLTEVIDGFIDEVMKLEVEQHV